MRGCRNYYITTNPTANLTKPIRNQSKPKTQPRNRLPVRRCCYPLLSHLASLSLSLSLSLHRPLSLCSPRTRKRFVCPLGQLISPIPNSQLLRSRRCATCCDLRCGWPKVLKGFPKTQHTHIHNNNNNSHRNTAWQLPRTLLCTCSGFSNILQNITACLAK